MTNPIRGGHLFLGGPCHLVLGVYWLCRLFNDVPATSARFPHLDPRDRSHAPPCQSAVGRCVFPVSGASIWCQYLVVASSGTASVPGRNRGPLRACARFLVSSSSAAASAACSAPRRCGASRSR